MCRQYASSASAGPGPNTVLLDDDDIDDQRLTDLAFQLDMNINELKSLQALANRIGMTTMSTAYSGIDSPGSAMLSLVAALGCDFGIHADHPHHFFAVECNDSCQVELQCHPASADCIFSDVADFLHPMLREKLPELQATNKLTTVLLPVVRDTPTKAMVSTLGH